MRGTYSHPDPLPRGEGEFIESNLNTINLVTEPSLAGEESLSRCEILRPGKPLLRMTRWARFTIHYSRRVRRF